MKYLWSIDLHFIFDKCMWQTSSMRNNNQDTHQGVHYQYDAYFRALQHRSSDQWKKFLWDLEKNLIFSKFQYHCQSCKLSKQKCYVLVYQAAQLWSIMKLVIIQSYESLMIFIFIVHEKRQFNPRIYFLKVLLKVCNKLVIVRRGNISLCWFLRRLLCISNGPDPPRTTCPPCPLYAI